MNLPRNTFTRTTQKSQRAIVKGLRQGAVGCTVIDFPFGTKWDDHERVRIAVDHLQSIFDSVEVKVYDVD